MDKYILGGVTAVAAAGGGGGGGGSASSASGGGGGGVSSGGGNGGGGGGGGGGLTIVDPDDQSEDGQLRSPYNHEDDDEDEDDDDDMRNNGGAGGNDDDDDDDDDDGSVDGADTADSLDIKPPQATSGRGDHHRYKEKKSRDKKHSKERRHKEKERMRDRNSRSERHRGHRNERDRIERDRGDRHHQQSGGGIGSGGGGGGAGGGRLPTSEDIRYEMHLRERDYYRHMYKERERERDRDHRAIEKRLKEQQQQQQMQQHDRRKDSPEKSEAERALEDLRSRLLSKRNKHDAERRMEAQQNVEYRSDRHVYRQSHYEYKKSKEEMRKEHHHQKHRSRKNVIELIDSPENYIESDSSTKYRESKQQQQQQQQQPIAVEDPELIARRSKLLEAEREMARRKELAREELEARREMRRERGEVNPISPPTPGKKRRNLSSDEEDEDTEPKKKLKENIVNVSDNSADDTASDTDTNSNTDSEGDESEGEVPVSPLSVGELSKSERRHRSRSKSKSSRSKSKSRSRSNSPYRSRSRSRSQSKSHSRSRTPSRSPRLRDRSRPESPDSDFEKDKNAEPPTDDENPTGNGGGGVAGSAGGTDVAGDKKDTKTTAPTTGAAAIAEDLPNYYPGIQGCRSVEEFQCLNRIEEGTYGVVYRARDKRTEEIVALKRLKMEKEKEGFPITSLREINTLLKGQHPNIVTVREIVVGSNMDKIFIVMDYVEHDMKSLMETMKHRKQAFLPAEVKCLLQQLLRAVGHLHDNWILHRDLKTSNLLLSHKGILKVGDFGLAREYGSPLKAYTSIVVTLWYRAPELLLCCKEYSTPIDMWSVGCIFAEFLSMTALFPGKSEIDQLNRIFKELGTPNEKIWHGYNDLPAVQKMTFTEYPVSNLRKRFSHLTSELGLSLLQGLLTYDPKQRYTAEQALASSYFKELPLPIDPAMFPTWPAKSELGARKALASSPKPPSGGGQFKQLGEHDDNHGFMINAMDSRQLAMGPGFSLKF